MADYKLTLKQRDVAGKKLKALRAQGLIPAVLYGGKAPILVMSEYVPTEKTVTKAGYHSPIDLDIDGKKQLAIVKDVQIDPVSRRIVNIEFQAISQNEVVEATTPVVIINFEAAEASKTYHYELDQVIEELAVKAKPADLPEELQIDAASLTNLDDKLTLADLKLPAGVELVDKEMELDQVIASLYDPAAEAAAREAENAAETEAEAAVMAEQAAEAENKAEAQAAKDAESATEDAEVSGK